MWYFDLDLSSSPPNGVPNWVILQFKNGLVMIFVDLKCVCVCAWERDSHIIIDIPV